MDAAPRAARRLRAPAARRAWTAMIPDPAGTGATLADIVIEAISEQPRPSSRCIARWNRA